MEIPDLTFSLEFEISTFQIDFSRHVSNIVYLQWLETARVKFLEHAGISVANLEEIGVLPVLTETQITYHKELRFGDRVTLTAWLSELKNASAWVDYRIFRQDGALCASARQRGLFIQGETRRPHRFTPQQKALLNAWLRTEKTG